MATRGQRSFRRDHGGSFIALDALTGKLLWRYKLRGTTRLVTISYAVDGRQYVAISGTGSMLTFALPK